jgi:hypothetical protein
MQAAKIVNKGNYGVVAFLLSEKPQCTGIN